MRKPVIDAKQISSTLCYLLNMIGIRIPFASETLGFIVKKWLNSIPGAELEKYVSVIRVAEKSAEQLRKKIQAITETASEEEKTTILSLFIVFLLANTIQSSKVEDND